MKSALRWLPLCFLFAGCGTIIDWREVKTDPMTIAECYDGFVYIAGKDGFAADTAACDRGLGTWQSRWRQRALPLGRPQRYRLRGEILLDEGSAEHGWTIRYAIEQEKVKDLRHSQNPGPSDWSPDGQDGEREATLGEKLARRLTVKKT
ncbi:MAG TPA: hypothetical protein VFD82_12640 [Planctomycetota bacterium]|nr:hypothetical protein [Planctomycetota bacterium]